MVHVNKFDWLVSSTRGGYYGTQALDVHLKPSCHLPNWLVWTVLLPSERTSSVMSLYFFLINRLIYFNSDLYQSNVGSRHRADVCELFNK